MSKWRFAGEWIGAVRPVAAPGTEFPKGPSPWQHRWEPLNEPRIAIRDPRDSSRWHHVQIHALKDGTDQKFAVGCFGDLWLFYVPAIESAVGALEARTVKQEGYWRASKDEVSDLPWPMAEPEWPDRDAFLNNLERSEERAERIAYRGMSICRICGCTNGYDSLHLAEWVWPSGYKHYILDHGVRPSAAFWTFIQSVGSQSRGSRTMGA